MAPAAAVFRQSARATVPALLAVLPQVRTHMALNAQFTELTVVHAAKQAFVASPMPDVRRKRLELFGPQESGRVTSVVEYAPKSKFRSHPHPQGEEILVLDGVFQDEHARYPAGTFALNPEGFEHAPFSEEGCTLLVKLRQSPGERAHVRTEVTAPDAAWRLLGSPSGGDTQTRVIALCDQRKEGFPEAILLVDVAAGEEARLDALTGAQDPELPDPLADDRALVELFVVEGECEIAGVALSQHSWLRAPARLVRNSALRGASSPATHARVYVKMGHAPPEEGIQ